MKLDDRMREAIVSSLKIEARRLGLTGDAFWAYVWHGAEEACIEAGDLPRKKAPEPRRARSA